MYWTCGCNCTDMKLVNMSVNDSSWPAFVLRTNWIYKGLKLFSPCLRWTFKSSTENLPVKSTKAIVEASKAETAADLLQLSCFKNSLQASMQSLRFHPNQYTSVHAFLESDLPKNPWPTCHRAFAILPSHSPVWRLRHEETNWPQSSFDEILKDRFLQRNMETEDSSDSSSGESAQGGP